MNWSGPLGFVMLVLILAGVAGLAYFVMRTPGAMRHPGGPMSETPATSSDTRRIERLLHRRGRAARDCNGSGLRVQPR